MNNVKIEYFRSGYTILQFKIVKRDEKIKNIT